jgi:hypothetical protein
MLIRIINWALEGLFMVVFLVLVILGTYVVGR